jgi:predicted outer membrane protein
MQNLRTYIRYVALVALMFLWGARGFAQYDTRMNQTDERDKDNGQPSFERDSRFLTSALQAGMAEVQLAQLALTKSSSSQIKAFAQTEIRDWAEINGSLNPYAKHIGVPIPTEISKKEKKVQDSLSGLSGNEFDLAYAKAMVKLHKDDVLVYRDELSERQSHSLAADAAPRATPAHFTLQDAAQQEVDVLEVLLHTAEQLADNKNLNVAAVEQVQANHPATKEQKYWTVPEMNVRLKEARDDNAQKKYGEAQTLMSQAVLIDPEAGALWLELGLALVGQEKYEEAIPDFNKAIALNSALKKPKPDVTATALNELGEAYAHANKIAEACNAFEAAAKARPEGAAFYYENEAIVLSRTDQTDAIVAAADKTIAADPTQPLPYYLKGQALISKASVDPKTNRILVPQEAVAAYQKYLELAPSGAQAGEVRQLLEAAGVKVTSTDLASKK